MNKLFWSLLSLGSASIGAISFCGGYGLFSKEKKDPNVPIIGPTPPGVDPSQSQPPPNLK